MHLRTVLIGSTLFLGSSFGGGCASDSYHEYGGDPYVVDRAMPAGYYSSAPWVYDPSYPYYYSGRYYRNDRLRGDRWEGHADREREGHRDGARFDGGARHSVETRDAGGRRDGDGGHDGGDGARYGAAGHDDSGGHGGAGSDGHGRH